jgi:hypothetical protein
MLVEAPSYTTGRRLLKQPDKHKLAWSNHPQVFARHHVPSELSQTRPFRLNLPPCTETDGVGANGSK